ncbi:hypothetical protein PYW07_015119 [Mythimna separata]|uniref:C2H2-type domain-containing protein n=1 Tax=Mythimna separata TaxID=271217 RepID=A0AAD7YWR2_MYTSE|nr:hypothetical protein PYW07_015119 [Mythimna separata]
MSINNPTSNTKSICYTCLSSGRTLKPIKNEEKFLLSMLCPKLFIYNKGNILYPICWECQYMIVKIKRFQARVTKAQALMKLCLKGAIPFVQSISDLKTTETQTIDLLDKSHVTRNEIPQSGAPTLTPIKVEPEMVKIEMEPEETCDDNDFDELIPPIKVPKPDSDDSTDTASESETYDDPLTVPIDKTTTNKSCIKPITVTSGDPKVTVKRVPIFIKQKGTVPTLLKAKDGITLMIKGKAGASFVPNVTGIVQTLTEGEVAPTCSKQEETILKGPIVPSSTNPPKEPPPREPASGQTAGMYGDEEDEIKCIILNKAELKTFRDKKRSLNGYKGHPFKCDKCVQKFPEKSRLEQHKKKHDKSQGPAMCEICEQRFPSRRVRNEHYMNHFIVYECLKCQYQDNDKFKTAEHFRRVHEVSSFYCKKCDAVFKTFREKRRHTINAHPSKKSTCEECGKIFQSMSQLKGHMKRVHQRETTDCPVCKKKIRKSYFDKHMKTHNDTRMDSAYCVECGKMFKSEKSYAFHLKTSLKHNSVEKFGNKCDHCDKYFHTKSALRDHLEEVNGLKYPCDICKKEFKNKRLLMLHTRFKHEGRKYNLKPKICEYCGKSFSSKKRLIEHVNSHLGLRPHVCQDCGASFSYSNVLFTHRRLVHKVKRRYEMPKVKPEGEH